jgi:two-component system, NtrC family, sensor kinase
VGGDAPDDSDGGKGEPRDPITNDPVAFLTRNLSRMGDALPRLLAQLRALGAPDELIAAAERGGERIDAYVPYLDAFGAPAAQEPVALDVRAVLDFVLRIAESEIRGRARVERRYGDVPRVRAAERHLGQVFSSLVVNAAQAIAPGAPDANAIELVTATDARGWARIEIADTGAGIAPDVLVRIFEPFFSTKRGAGMGLGLYLARATVGALGGTIDVTSAIGRGTRFTIALPPA